MVYKCSICRNLLKTLVNLHLDLGLKLGTGERPMYQHGEGVGWLSGPCPSVVRAVSGWPRHLRSSKCVCLEFKFF